MGFLAFITFDRVNNLVGILYIIFNVFLYTVVVFLVNGKIKSMNEWMNEWMNDFWQGQRLKKLKIVKNCL